MTSPATILIVDDELQNRRLLEALLRPEGYLTTTASNGEEALASIARQAPDLILLDAMMPKLNGYQVVSLLKANPATASIPVIMVTALTDREARLAGLNAGAEEFLTSPVDRAELWARVRNLLRLKTLGDMFQHHSLQLEQQVQARTASLRDSELKFRQMAESIRDVFFLFDSDSYQFLYVSPVYAEIFGRSCQSLYENAQSWADAIHPDDQAAVLDKYGPGKSLQQLRYECRIVRPDGTIRWIETRGFPVLDAAGGRETARFAGIIEDITERREAADRIAQLNRVHEMLSGINTLIVRAHTRDELFRGACQMATEAGGFRLAFIGMVDRDTAKIVPVAASSQDEAQLADIRGILSSREHAPTTLVNMAIDKRETIVSNDTAHDSRIRFGAHYARAGIRSVAILPLLVTGEAVGVIALYAGERDYFHEKETQLLAELANDIAFAIDHIENQERLNHLAYYDGLTGLANRPLFLDRLTQYLHGAAGTGHKVAVIFIDLERFKSINDSLGQATGDILLKQVTQWLTRRTGDANLLAHIGADHFAAILPGINQADDIALRFENLLAAFQECPFALNGGIFRIAAKLGVAVFPEDGANAETLFKNAETALKKAKANGERYLFYTPNMTASVAGKLTLENQLRQALDREEFVLHYQPKVNLVTGMVTSAEALIRWNDPRTGLVAPGHFIPVLEETGLIYDVGRWALSKAIADYLRWRAAGLAAVRISVNVSPLQLRNHGFVAEIERNIGVDVHAAAGLELEITESLIMENVKHNISSLQAIRAMGVNIAIDDFGTGFSSLSYLAKLPVDALKIDRSFIIDMTTSAGGLALVSTIVGLAHALKLCVVAEGVETERQSELLRSMDCDEIQGYLFSKPVPADIFESRFLVPAQIPASHRAAT